MEIKDILKQLRKSRGLSQIKLANDLNVSKSLIAAYETGTRKPSYEMLIDLSSYFKVSADYIIGNTNNVVYQLDQQTNDLLQKLLARPDLCRILNTAYNFPPSTVNQLADFMENIRPAK